MSTQYDEERLGDGKEQVEEKVQCRVRLKVV
jgi:hypothetical protein